MCRNRLEYVESNDNIADILTKSLPQPLHEYHMVGLGVRKQGDFFLSHNRFSHRVLAMADALRHRNLNECCKKAQHEFNG